MLSRPTLGKRFSALQSPAHLPGFSFVSLAVGASLDSLTNSSCEPAPAALSSARLFSVRSALVIVRPPLGFGPRFGPGSDPGIPIDLNFASFFTFGSSFSGVLSLHRKQGYISESSRGDQ